VNLREAAQQALDEWHTDPGSVRMASLMMALRTALAEPEQEPVAWKDTTYGNLHHQNFGGCIPLYTHPPQRKPLTDEEIELLAVKHAPPIDPAFAKDDDFIEFARAIERAHGIGGEE
jgi:hypothetical protein